MTLFVDASALVALIAAEPERDAFAHRIGEADGVLFSPMVCWEAVSGLRRSYDFAIGDARSEVKKTIAAAAGTLVGIGERELEIALDAYQLYGKGHHPAQLNMGDCFAYACAKANNAALLYKGDDFAHTDLA